MKARTALASLLLCVGALAVSSSASALDIADAVPPTGTVGVPYSYTFSLSPGSGSPGSSWSIKSGLLPPGLALSSNDRTATVYGTPTQAGSFSFYIEVRDAPGPWICCTQEEFTIVVDPGLEIPTGSDLPTGNVGAAYGYQLATAGGVAASWAITAGSLPAGMELTAGGALTGTPTQAALAQFTVKAVSGSRSASKQFTLKVTEPLVVATPRPTAVKLGRQFLVAFAVKGGLAPYTWSGVGLPEGVGVSPTTGRVGGRPKVAGPLTVAVQVTDALGVSATARATVTVATRLAIVTSRLPAARSGKRFAARLVVSGGARPVTFRLAGSRPAWLGLDGGRGELAGTPRLDPRKPVVVLRKTKQGTKRVLHRRPPATAVYHLYVTAVDALGQRSTQKLKLTVRP